MSLPLQQVSTNKFACSEWIVDGDGPSVGATHTTIAAALTTASSGDTIFIRPGTYVEDLTLVAGVCLTAFLGDAITPNVTIEGNITQTWTGTVTLSNVRLDTSSGNIITSSGTNAAVLELNNCFLLCSDNSGITLNNANSSVVIRDSRGDLATTSISLFTITAGTITFFDSLITNSGGSTTANTAVAATLSMTRSELRNPVTTSSTAVLNMRHSTIFCSAINQTALTAGGSGNHDSTYGLFTSGTASAISVGNNLNISHPTISSSNTNAITGAGSLTYGAVNFTGSSSLVNTTTTAGNNLNVAGVSFDDGANHLDDYEEGTFTAVLIGVDTAGAGTYSTQVGTYTKIGRQVTCNLDLVWSAHTGTGLAKLGTWPFSTTSCTEAAVGLWCNNWTTAPEAFIIDDSALNGFIFVNNDGGGVTLDVAASIKMQFSYETTA